MKIFYVACVFLVVTVSAAFSGDTSGLPSTITVGKDVYEDVHWGDVSPASVTIFHKSGIARIPLKSLPPEIQKQLGYDPEKKKTEAAKAKAEAERAATEQADKAVAAKAAADAERGKAGQARVEAAKVVAATIADTKRKRTQPDPVAELKEVMQLFAAMNATAKHAFDVTKTDSLVSPYLGTVTYVDRHHYEKGDDFTPPIKTSFAYQEKKWELKKLCCRDEAEEGVLQWCYEDGQPPTLAQLTQYDGHVATVHERMQFWFASEIALPHLTEEHAQWEDALRIYYSN